jgi:DNA-binding NtrC family response regulator
LTIPGGLGAKETMALLLQLDPRAQAIISSGYGNDPIMANYEHYGFKGVIAKPYKILELSLVIENLLSKRKTPQRKKIIKSKTAVHSDSI